MYQNMDILVQKYDYLVKKVILFYLDYKIQILEIVPYLFLQHPLIYILSNYSSTATKLTFTGKFASQPLFATFESMLHVQMYNHLLQELLRIFEL